MTCRRANVFLALHDEHRQKLAAVLDIDPRRIKLVGAGYNDTVFAPLHDPTPRQRSVVYAGKLSAAKGLPWLLDAVEQLAAQATDLHLHVAGDGAGPEADELKARMERSEAVTWHGALPQRRLATLLASARVFALPSFYEGLPLVLVEAAAMGCRLVVTELGALNDLRGPLSPALHTVPMPPLSGPDAPLPEAIPGFVRTLAATLKAALASPAPPPLDLETFTWGAVAERVQTVWRQLLDDGL